MQYIVDQCFVSLLWGCWVAWLVFFHFFFSYTIILCSLTGLVSIPFPATYNRIARMILISFLFVCFINQTEVIQLQVCCQVPREDFCCSPVSVLVHLYVRSQSIGLEPIRACACSPAIPCTWPTPTPHSSSSSLPTSTPWTSCWRSTLQSAPRRRAARCAIATPLPLWPSPRSCELCGSAQEYSSY